MVGVWRSVTVAVAAVACLGPVLLAQPAAAQTPGCDTVNDPALDQQYSGISAFNASMAEGDTVTVSFTAEVAEVNVTLSVFDDLGGTLFTQSGPTPATFSYLFVAAAPSALVSVTIGNPLSSSSANVTFECVAAVIPESTTTTTTPTTTTSTPATTAPTTTSTTSTTSTSTTVSAAVTTTAGPTTTTAAAVPSPTPGEELPSTGNDTWHMAAIALLLVSFGFAAVRVSRRQL